MIPTALSGLLPAVLKTWVRQYPHVNILIEPGSTNALYAKVLDDSVDAAILAHPGFDLPKTCAWQSLRREPLVLLTPAAMRVANAFDTIAREPYIRHNRSVIAGRLADDYLHRHGVRPNVRFELEGIESIARLVSEGLGVSVLPDWAVPGPVDPSVRRWPLPAPFPSRDVGVVGTAPARDRRWSSCSWIWRGRRWCRRRGRRDADRGSSTKQKRWNPRRSQQVRRLASQEEAAQRRVAVRAHDQDADILIRTALAMTLSASPESATWAHRSRLPAGSSWPTRSAWARRGFPFQTSADGLESP